jgi:aerobic-type carbon monoxide dehydrogenase small subunit (CoxS/CutS family)
MPTTIKELHVNGARRPIDADADRSLLSVLRDDLDLVGCKYGCGEGMCGACTVLVDGQPIHSCHTKVGTIEGQKIRTVEDLEKDGKLHPLQEAFLKADAFQCGYCTCGMLMSALALLTKNPTPSRKEIVRGLNGNLCRCGAYQRIVTAVETAAQAMKGGDK